MENEVYNWKIVENDRTTNDLIAETQKRPQNGFVVTHLNTDMFPTASDISWARTIVHESIHAYVVSFAANKDITLRKGTNY